MRWAFTTPTLLRVKGSADHSLDPSDLHHVEVAVKNASLGLGCMDDSSAAGVKGNVAAVVAVVIADNVTDPEIGSGYRYAVAVADGVGTVGKADIELCIAVHDKTRAVDTAP